MSDLCTICGLVFHSASMGGPGICPACDCGVPASTGQANAKLYAVEAERDAALERALAAERDAEWLREQIRGSRTWMWHNASCSYDRPVNPLCDCGLIQYTTVLDAALSREKQA